METVEDSLARSDRAGAPGGGTRPARSGEGARSAMEQLALQQSSRDAQRPRDEAHPAPPAKAPR
jgi:hypothetical protein